MRIITIGQASGVTRYLAVSYRNERPGMVDHLPSLACLDVSPDGSREWAAPSKCADTEEGRNAILDHLYNYDDCEEGRRNDEYDRDDLGEFPDC